MARHRGRVVVKKVDEFGVKISNLKAWLKANPGKMHFDSTPEWAVWKYMVDANIPHKTQTTLSLFPGMTTEEFQLPRQTKKAKSEKRNTREIKVVKQLPMSYTPDYYLPEFDTYIEVKGYADEVFKLRWKLFKLKGHKGFIVYSLKEFQELYVQLKANSLLTTI